MSIENAVPTVEAVTLWSREYIADLLDVPVGEIDSSIAFDRMGIDSAHAVALLIDIEERYGVDIPPEALFDDPTLDAVAEQVLSHLRSR